MFTIRMYLLIISKTCIKLLVKFSKDLSSWSFLNQPPKIMAAAVAEWEILKSKHSDHDGRVTRGRRSIQLFVPQGKTTSESL